MKKLIVPFFAVLIIAGLLYAKSVQKSRRLWNAEIPGAAIDIQSDKDLSVNYNLNVDGDVAIDGKNLDLGDANIDYDSTNFEVDVDTRINVSAQIPVQFSVTVDTTSVSPTAAGQVVLGTDYNLYVSSASGGSWYKVGGK